jgi:hypothetical protein
MPAFQPEKTMVSNGNERILKTAEAIEASSKLGISLSSMGILLEGNPLPQSALDKIERALKNRAKLSRIFFRRPLKIVRLLQVYDLYKEKGTLEAAGDQLGLTRERIRQLLMKGVQLGLFEYKRRRYHVVSREKIVEDFKRGLNFTNVARANHISVNTLRKLVATYNIAQEIPFCPHVVSRPKIPRGKITKEKIIEDFKRGLNFTNVARENHISLKTLGEFITACKISDEELLAIRIEGHKLTCIDDYHRIKKELGHHPSTTELQRSRRWWLVAVKIKRLWGSLEAFRRELNVPVDIH